jgi:hypothetical protein
MMAILPKTRLTTGRVRIGFRDTKFVLKEGGISK